MSDDIPFDKSFDLAPDIVDQVAPGVRRVLANNPSPFTFKGTLSYIVGQGHVAIIDPGPLDEAHIAALLDAVRGETVTHIFVTHTHRDHSPAVPRIKATLYFASEDGRTLVPVEQEIPLAEGTIGQARALMEAYAGRRRCGLRRRVLERPDRLRRRARLRKPA